MVTINKRSRLQTCSNTEKQIKAGSREKKIALIEEQNSSWKDLYLDFYDAV